MDRSKVSYFYYSLKDLQGLCKTRSRIHKIYTWIMVLRGNRSFCAACMRASKDSFSLFIILHSLLRSCSDSERLV